MNPLDGIVKFNEERKLNRFSEATEVNLLQEELNEFVCAVNDHERIDALCDLIVVAAGGIYKLGYDPTEALIQTVKEISSRQGAINETTGKWEKDRNQDPSTLYKADYYLARR